MRYVEAFIFDAIRTPRGRGKPGKDGKPGGSLYEVKPVSLVAGLLDELRRRYPDLDPAAIDDVVLGCVTAVGEQGIGASPGPPRSRPGCRTRSPACSSTASARPGSRR